MPRRYDFESFSPDQITRTPSGGVEIPARVTRTGMFLYRTTEGQTVREYRPPEEVFSRASLDSIQGAPVTIGHPPEMVNPANFVKYSRGHLVDGSVAPEDIYVGARLAVNAEDALSLILSEDETRQLREISCGYDCKLDAKPGVTPEGERYDRIQREIVYNHCALLPRGMGRAGSAVELRLDAKDDVCLDESTPEIPPRRRRMRIGTIKREGHFLRVDGVSFNLKTKGGRRGAREAISVLQERTREELAELKTRKDAIDPASLDTIVNALLDLQKQCHEMAATSAAEEKTADAKVPGAGGEQGPSDVVNTDDDGDEDEEEDDEDEPEKKPGDGQGKDPKSGTMDALVEERTDALDKVRALDPKYDGKGKSTLQVMRDGLKKHDKTLKFDGLSDAEIKGMFRMLRPARPHDSFARLRTATAPESRSDSGGEPSAKQKYTIRLADAWKGKKVG